MIDFITNFYKEIIVLIVLVIELLSSFIFLIKKSKREPSTNSILLSKLPVLIADAEKKYGAGTGPEKKAYVMNFIKLILKNYGLSEDKFLLSDLESQIELILSTPSKKGNR